MVNENWKLKSQQNCQHFSTQKSFYVKILRDTKKVNGLNLHKQY